MKHHLSTLVAALAATSVLSAAPAMAQSDWPERPVTIIVPAGAGGGTDQTARMLSARLEEQFGQPFNVVNQGQGGGVVGITNIKEADPNGYTIGVIYNFAHYKPMGQADFDAEDFTAVAQYNFDPAGFHVHADSEWATITEALDAIEADPTAYDIACGGGCGGSWPIAVATLMKEWGIDLSQVTMISGQGAAPALQDLAAGGVDVVPSSVPEAGALIEAGRVRGLAVFGTERLAAFPDIPTLEEETGLALSLGAWRGVVGPDGLPDGIVDALEGALDEIVHSEEWRQAMTERGFGIQWRDSAAFAEFMRQQQEEVRGVVADLGL
ncbi:MAG: tripartite tricarboxylate transporter substrate binding protein [Azospirillaceae bacterium]